jgi:hypothetical protein
MKILASAPIAVLDPDADRRTALCCALAALGLRRLLPLTCFEEARALEPGRTVALCVVDITGTGAAHIPGNPFERAKVPAILIAPEAGRGTRRAAALLGYSDVLPSPCAARTLYRRIGSILQKARRTERRSAPELAAVAASTIARLSES